MVGDRAYIVTDLLNAIMASVGGDSAESAEMDGEPLTVITLDFSEANRSF